MTEPGLIDADRAAITALICGYAEMIDDGDFEGIGELFAHATIGAYGDTRGVTGTEAAIRLYESTTRRYPEGTPRTHHVTTNLIADPDGAGRARSRSYFTVLQAVDGALALQPVIAGRYHDRFERIDGEWRFAERRMEVRLVGDLSHHLLSHLPD